MYTRDEYTRRLQQIDTVGSYSVGPHIKTGLAVVVVTVVVGVVVVVVVVVNVDIGPRFPGAAFCLKNKWFSGEAFCFRKSREDAGFQWPTLGRIA